MKIFKKTIEYLLYLFIFLLPWQAAYIYYSPQIGGEVWEFGVRSLRATEILLLIILILYVAGAIYFLIKKKALRELKKVHKKIFSSPSYIWGLFLFLLWAGISALWAKDMAQAWYKWTILLEGIIIYFFLVKENFLKYNRVLFSFIAGAVIQSVFAIQQFALQAISPNKWLGIAEHLPADLGASVVETSLRRWLRAYGSFPHPNVLAAYLGVAFLLLVSWNISQEYHWFEKSSSYFYKFIHKKKTKKDDKKNFVQNKTTDEEEFLSDPSFASAILRLLNSGLVWLLALGILCSFSRSVWLGIVIGLFVLVFRNFRKVGDLLSSYNLGFIILFAVVIFSLREPMIARVTGNGRLEEKSILERTLTYKQGWDIIKDNWLLGTGMGNYTLEVYSRHPDYKIWECQPIHDFFMLIWAELGIIGLLLILFSCYAILKATLKSPQNNLFFLFVFMIFISISDHYFWTLYPGMILWWLGMGLIFNAQHK